MKKHNPHNSRWSDLLSICFLSVFYPFSSLSVHWTNCMHSLSAWVWMEIICQRGIYWPHPLQLLPIRLFPISNVLIATRVSLPNINGVRLKKWWPMEALDGVNRWNMQTRTMSRQPQIPDLLQPLQATLWTTTTHYQTRWDIRHKRNARNLHRTLNRGSCPLIIYSKRNRCSQ